MSLVLHQIRCLLLVIAVCVGLSAGESTGTGLVAAYWANETLSGTPTVTRTDAQVNFAWAGGAVATGMPVDSFSARWDGEIEALFSEPLTIIARTDDGVRLWINGSLVIDAWVLRGAADSTYTFTAEAGQRYRIRMEYYEHFGSAVAQLDWQSGTLPRAAIPTTQLYPVIPAEAPAGTGTGLLARYFANETLSEAPVVTRTDATVDFNWGGTSPDADVPVDGFSARWDGEIEARYSEPLTITVRTDDGVRVWLDGILVVDAWVLRSAANSTFTFSAEAGHRYRIRMEYFEHTGSAVAKLWWQSASEFQGPIPSSQLYPTPANDPPVGTGTGLLARFYTNETLSGAPVLTRTDARVDFDWAGGSPGSGVPADVFSARWDGEIEARTTEALTLILRTDDGVRLWLDDQLVINAWVLRGAADSTYSFNVQAGQRYRIRIDYFEHHGSAVAKLWWQSPSEPKAPVPTSQLYPTAPVEPPLGTGTGLAGSYFTNETLTGTPALVRLDPVVDFDWAGGSPGSPLVADSFSTRWEGEFEPRYTEDLTLIARTDDGVRVWINDEPVITAWVLRGATDSTYTFAAQAGQRYRIRMEYCEHFGSAVAKLWWQSAHEFRGPIPTTQLYPAPIVATPVLGFATAASAVSEKSGSTTIAVALAPASTTAVTASLSVVGSGIQAPASITIPAGETTVSIPVTIQDDPRYGPDRQVTLALANPAGAVLGQTTHVLTLQNTESKPTIGFTTATSFNLEQSGTASVIVRLSAVSAVPTTVSVVTSGTATSGVDYAAPAATLQIPADTFEGTIFIPLLADTEPEADETIVLTLANPVDATLGALTAHTLTLSDGNLAPVIVSGPTPSTNPVTGTSVDLTLVASDDGAPVALTTTWSVVGTPPGAVTFTPPTSMGLSVETVATFAAPGTYTIQAQVRDAYNATDTEQVTVTVVASRQPQTITFTAPPAKTYGDVPFTLTATASSGLPVILTSADTSIATVDGATVTIVGAGNTSITAAQPGDATWEAAAPVTHPLTVAKAAQTITFAALSQRVVNDAPFTLTATASSGQPVSYISSNTSVATVSGSTVTILTAGTTTITASQAGTANYLAAASVDQVLTVAKQTQTITFAALAGKTYGDAPFTLTAAASSGLPVSYVSSNSTVATVSGNTVTIVAAGTTTITASQTGDDTYEAAQPIDQLLTVVAPVPAISPTFTPPAGTYTTAQSVTITSSTPNAVIYYTIDGSNPADSPTRVAVSGAVPLNGGTPLQAITTAVGHASSEVASASYVFQTTLPTITPNGGNFSNATQVTLTTPTVGAEIRYTLDGSEPTQTSQGGSAPLTITLAQNGALAARVFKSGWLSSGTVTSVPFAFQVATPTLTPTTGTFAGSVTVNAATVTSGASLRYTLDGSVPTSESPIIPGALMLTESTTVKVVGFRTGFTPSDVTAISYTVNPLPTVSFTTATSSLDKAGGIGQITVTLSGPLDEDIYLPYLLHGTAEQYQDYYAYETLTSGGLDLYSGFSIPAGVTTFDIFINANDDGIGRPDKTVIIDLLPPAGLAEGAFVRHTATIIDNNPPTVGFTTSYSTVTEDVMEFEVFAALSKPTDVTVTFDYLVINGSAVEGTDFHLAPGTVIIPAGETQGSISGTIVYLEGENGYRDFQIELTNPTNAVLQYVEDLNPSLSVSIEDVDGAPMIYPGTGTYLSPPTVYIISPASSGTIRYTLDGSDPTESSPAYIEPITISGPATLTTRLFRAGLLPTPSASAIYVFQVPTPSLTPSGRRAYDVLAVQPSVNLSDVVFRYTTDSSEPTGSSQVATGAILVDRSLTLKVAGFRTGYITSSTAASNYTLAAAPVYFTPSSGTYSNVVVITPGSASPGVEFRYTTDGSIPTASSPALVAPLTIDHGQTVHAIATRDGWSTSQVSSTTYAFQVAPPTLTVVPQPGGFDSEIVVAASCSTLGAQMRYTLDGSTPTDSSPVLASPLTLTSTTTVTVIGLRAGFAPSVPTQQSFSPQPDNTAVPQIAFGTSVGAGDASVGSVQVPVVLSRASSDDISVAYAVSSATATETDVQIEPGTVTIPAGEISGIISFSVFSHAQPQPDVFVRLQLADPVGAVLGTQSSFTYTIRNDVLPAPVIRYTKSTLNGTDMFGVVPDGLGLTEVSVLVPDGVSATSVIKGGMFNVRITNAAPPLSAMAVTLSYRDQHGHTGPTTATTISMGDGSGGSVETGTPEELPPSPPTIALTFAPGSLTGDEKGKIDDQEVHFTKRGKDAGEAIILQVSAGISLGTVQSINVSCSDGQTKSIMGSSGTASFILPEGRYRLTATAIGTNGTSIAYGYLQEPLVLIVDRTPPALRYTSHPRFWSNASKPEFIDIDTTFAQSAYWADAIIYLNSNPEEGSTGNKELRRTKSWNYFNKQNFAFTATVMDGTKGLRSNSEKRAYVSSDEYLLRVSPEMGSDNEITALNIDDFSSLDSDITRNRTFIVENLEDRAGNKAPTHTYLTICCKTNPNPDAIGNDFTQGAVWSPIRHLGDDYWSENPSIWPERWQGNAPTESDRMFRGTHFYLNGDWLLPKPVDVSGVAADDSISEPILLRDLAGNMLTITRNWAGLQTYPGPSFSSGNSGGVNGDMPLDDTGASSSIGTTIRFGYDPVNEDEEGIYLTQLISGDPGHYWFQVTSSVGEDTQTDLAFKGRLTGLWPLPRWEEAGESAIRLNSQPTFVPIYPGPDDVSRHVRPAIMTFPPSWKKNPSSVRVVVRDPGLNQHDVLDALMTPMGGRGEFDTTGVLQKIAPDVAAIDFIPERPVMDLQYIAGAGEVFYKASSSGYANNHAYVNYGSRWMNVLILKNDLVRTGSLNKLIIMGNFLDGTFGPGDFSAIGNYVRFNLNGNDITVSASEYQSASAPEGMENSIAIVGQRFVARGWHQAYMQILELDVAVGSAVEPGIYSLDIKIGDVRYKGPTPGFEEADENNPDPAKGENGAYRMNEALAVVGIDLEEQYRDDNGQVSPNNWVKRFTYEQSKPVVKITSPYSGEFPPAANYQGGRQVSVAGTVRDLCSEITGLAPSMTINGQSMPLSGSNGYFSFSGNVTVGFDGLISAQCSDAYGNIGADELVIAKEFTSPADATAPVNPPEDPAVLNGPHGYVFARRAYSVTSDGAGYSLTSTDVASGTSTTVAMTSAGTIAFPGGEDGDQVISVPVFISNDALWLMEVHSRAEGDANTRGSMAVVIRIAGHEDHRQLIESEPGSGAFGSQAIELRLTGEAAELSPSAPDSFSAVIYRPFAPRITVDLVETGASSGVYTNGNVTIALANANGVSGVLAVVTAPSLGISAAPIVISPVQAAVVAYASAPLLMQTATTSAGGPPEPGSVQEEYRSLPIASAMPQPRAKRIIIRIPNAVASTKTLRVTTDTGTTHDLAMTKVGDSYQSGALFFEVGASGSKALGGFPVNFETTGGGQEGSSDDDIPVAVVDDVGGEGHLRFVDANWEPMRDVIVRRLPNGTTEPDVKVIRTGTEIAGLKVRLVSGPPLKFAEERRDPEKFFITVDETTWAQLEQEAEAAKEHAEFVDASMACEAEEAAAAKALAKKYGVTKTGWQWVGPRSLDDWKEYSKGFAVGTGQQINETINPWEILKGLGSLAAFVYNAEYEKTEAGELFKKVLIGYIEESSKLARARKYYESGVAAGNAIIFYLSIPVGVASAPAAVAKFASVCKSARFKIVVLPKNSSVYFGSLAGGIQSFLDRLALRISYATYTVNATTTRVVGPAVAYVNDALIAAKIGTRASAVQFIGVSPARFTSRELERGHLISKQFGGRGIQANLVPMYHRVNQVEMRNVEKQVEAYAKQGKDVQYSVEAIYGTPPGGHPSIPEFIKVDIIVDGVKVYDDLIPNVP